MEMLHIITNDKRKLRINSKILTLFIHFCPLNQFKIKTWISTTQKK